MQQESCNFSELFLEHSGKIKEQSNRRAVEADGAARATAVSLSSHRALSAFVAMAEGRGKGNVTGGLSGVYQTYRNSRSYIC